MKTTRTLSLLGILLLGGLIIASGFTLAAPKRLSSWDPQVKELLARMTLDEKIGQMTQPDQMLLKDVRDIETYFIGSLLNGGDSDPKTNSLQDWTDMYDNYQSHALKTRLGIPLIYGVDAVHGHNNVLNAVVFPHNIGLGCTRNPRLVEQCARITAEEVRATGINWTFSPCVTVPQDVRWGRSYEGFGEKPELAESLGEAAVRGFQGDNLADPLSIAACAKHYVGDGGTTFGTGLPRQGNRAERGLDQGDTRLSEADLRRIHLPGYVAAIRAGVATIMPSYSSWNGLKVSGSKRLLTEILKQEMGFEGFLISDYDALNQLPGDYRSQIQQSINAGMDMVMVPSRYREFFTTLKALAREGGVPMSRIDDAVTRILRVKFAMGLMDKSRSPLADRRLHATFGSSEHRLVARDAVRQSVVLMKNDQHTLPISKRLARIHVAGKNADDIGNQCGGWTIRWQGQSGNVTTGGTTILAAIRQAAPGAKISYSRDGTGAAGADVAIAVIGEKPYAEMLGDRTDLALAGEDIEVVNNLRQAGIPVVVVLISGRPLDVEPVLGKSNALLAAWLPGTEGEGVADVLFGDYKPKGKLSFSFPNSTFKYGYGLTF